MASFLAVSHLTAPQAHAGAHSRSSLLRSKGVASPSSRSSKSRFSKGYECLSYKKGAGMHRTRTHVILSAQKRDMNAGMAAELVGKMDATEAGRVLSVLPPYKVVEIIEGAIEYKRWDTPALTAAQIYNQMETRTAVEVMRLLSQRTAIDVLSRMDSKAAARIVDQLEFPGGILLSMNADSAVNIVKASEKKQDLFRESEWKEFQELQELIEQRDADIEGIEWYLMYAEQMTRGRLQLLNDQGRWEPFEESGLRGWLFLLIVVGVPAALAFVSLVDILKAGQDLEKLISK